MSGLMTHFEPYLYLAEVTDRSALLSWGGFFFWISAEHPTDGNDWMLIDDDDLDHIFPPREDTIGRRSHPYDKTPEGALVQIFDATGGEEILSARAPGANHCWVSGLEADTEYRYRVVVNGKPWAEGELRDWVADEDFQGLRKSGRRYDTRFRTRPSVEQPTGLKFAVLGDFGRGVHYLTDEEHRQQEVARALELSVNREDLRLLITTGDNIYKHKAGGAGGSGKEDDDWFFSFYQPYRYIINRIPVYPSCGNHDSGETISEPSDDRQQLNDNFYVQERFSGLQGLASIEPGLFYRIRYGSNIEFISIDTSRNSIFPFADRNFEHPNHQAFLKAAFPPSSGNDSVWRIPFGHHPPYCAGPLHDNNNDVLEKVINKLCIPSGVRIFFSGHEHNFQHSQADGVDFFVTGGGGDIRLDDLDDDLIESAKTHAWGKGGHFLLVEIEGDTMKVTPIGELSGPASDPQSSTLAVFKPNSTVKVQPPFIVQK
jgi:tartrate-resistant acid phosphatase type 5